jgi:PAS domain S-box-containing protein
MQRTDELTTANRRLRDEESRLQSILDNSTAIVYVKDSLGRYLLVNSQFTRLFHMTAEEVIGKTDAEVFPAETAARFRANDIQVQTERRAIQFEEMAPHDDGPHHYISVKFPLLEMPDGSCSVCGISTDITDRKVSEERLRNEERLLRRLLDSREREKMLLAYDIHDGLVQDIVGAKMILEGRGGELEDGATLDAKSYQQVLRLLVQAIEEGRRMISELRPPILDEQGIIGSIEYLVAEQFQKSGNHIRFKHNVNFDRISPLLEQTVFRIVQEALNNVVRHSTAPEAEVNLTQTGQRIRIEIRDRGVGFDPADVPADRFGLRGIVERARLFGGIATIDSQPDKGTCVIVEVPIEQDTPSA